jgi:hypothetical protein
MPDSPLRNSTAQTKPWGLWATLGLSGITLAVFFTIQRLILSIAAVIERAAQPNVEPDTIAENLATNGFWLTIVTLVAAPICIALIIGFIKLRPASSIKDYLNLKPPNIRQLFEWCLITILFVATVDLLKSLADQPIVPVFVSNIYATALSLPLFCFAFIVVAPVFEEILFRGFLFQGIRYSFLGEMGAVVISSALWILLNLQYSWLDILRIFVLGLLLGFSQLKTQSLYVSIAMQILNSLVAIIEAAFSAFFQISG